MTGRMPQPYNDEPGGIVAAIVTIGLLVIIIGGVLYARNGGLAEFGTAVQTWLCEHIPGACG